MKRNYWWHNFHITILYNSLNKAFCVPNRRPLTPAPFELCIHISMLSFDYEIPIWFNFFVLPFAKIVNLDLPPPPHFLIFAFAGSIFKSKAHVQIKSQIIGLQVQVELHVIFYSLQSILKSNHFLTRAQLMWLSPHLCKWVMLCDSDLCNPLRLQASHCPLTTTI